MADTQVNFVRCSQTTYDELEKDDNTIYFILDKGKIYQVFFFNFTEKGLKNN